jgi:D-lactate dehydrogenase
MERLVIYDAGELDCSGLYALGNHHKRVVIGERREPLTAETADATATMAAVFVGSKVDRRALSRMPHLKLVLCLSTGFDHVDLNECRKRGITVCNVPAYGERTVAEYTMALMLSLSRRIPESANRLKHGLAGHNDLTGFDLFDKTLTVIGTGRIGRHVIKYARAFGMTVLGVDAYPNQEAAAELGFEYVGLHEGLKRAGVVSLHAPLTAETRHMLNRRSLAAMKDGALLINTARGELVDTTAVLHALHTKKLGGAALDVIEGEKYLGGEVQIKVLSDGSVKHEVIRDIAEHDALLKLPNVIITNHNAFNTHEAHRRIMTAAAASATAFLDGQALHVVQ